MGGLDIIFFIRKGFELSKAFDTVNHGIILR